MQPSIIRWIVFCCTLDIVACTQSHSIGLQTSYALRNSAFALVKSAIVTEYLRFEVTARLDRQSAEQLLKLISRGHAPGPATGKVRGEGYVPISYQVVLATQKGNVTVFFFGHCQSCMVEHKELDFDDVDAQLINTLIDPKGLWRY